MLKVPKPKILITLGIFALILSYSLKFLFEATIPEGYENLLRERIIYSKDSLNISFITKIESVKMFQYGIYGQEERGTAEVLYLNADSVQKKMSIKWFFKDGRIHIYNAHGKHNGRYVTFFQLEEKKFY